MSSPKKDPKKIPKKIQPTLFGVQKFQIIQKLTKKVGKNETKVVNEFVRVENLKMVKLLMSFNRNVISV